MFSIARKLSSLASLHPLLPLAFLSSPNSSPYLPPLSPPSPSAENLLLTLPRFFSSQRSSPSPLALSFIRGGCHEADNPRLPSFPLCPGCGVHMQDSDPTFPGFFSLPSSKSPDYRALLSPTPDPQIALSLKSGLLQEHEKENPDTNPSDSSDEQAKHLVCSRCHSLRHYGRVKVPSADNLLPDFDFHRVLTPMMTSGSGPRSMVLLVVDAADFDGSFPRKVARLLSASINDNARAWKENKPANIPMVVLVVTKVDLLPRSVSLERLDEWARRRAHVWGVVKLAGVHLVSALRDWGVRNLVEQVAEFAGSRGNVWAVGAQNAGKSTLINAMGRCVGQKMTQLTEAPMPGTTLGIVRVEGILCGQAKLFDTPGILHPFQITTRLTREEQKLVHMSKELKPRTYRIKVGHSVHIGGLMRLDVEDSSADTIYLTVWASPLLPLHMGKKENSCRMMEDHFGLQLQPPIGKGRIRELGKWVRSEFRINGNSWTESSTDIAAAGLGWVAVCLKGEAVLGVWTYDGIGVVARKSLITRKAQVFEEAGFTVSKIVSHADSKLNKEKQNQWRKVKVTSSQPLTSDSVLNA